MVCTNCFKPTGCFGRPPRNIHQTGQTEQDRCVFICPDGTGDGKQYETTGRENISARLICPIDKRGQLKVTKHKWGKDSRAVGEMGKPSLRLLQQHFHLVLQLSQATSIIKPLFCPRFAHIHRQQKVLM